MSRSGLFSRVGLWFALCGVAVSAGCGADDTGPITPEQDAGADAADAACVSDNDCNNGSYCDGVETCDANDPNADPITHCVAGVEVVCNDDIACTTDACDEAIDECAFVAPDADGDSRADAACLDANGEPLGDDCDDSDPSRYPGNTEICVPGPNSASATHDEDCDLDTLGERDEDGDGHIDARCCNTGADDSIACGDDCDDDVSSAYSGAMEICDGIDNDCDASREVDNGLFCGACSCSVPNATPSCTAGPTQCTVGVCDTSFLNCDMNQQNGCEANRADDQTCGQCGNVCTEHASCAEDGGTFACACDDGYVGDGVTCTACETGYAGDGAGGCSPVLLGLDLSVGTLSPALSPNGVSYSARVGIANSFVDLTPVVGAGVSIEIDTDTVSSGQAWRSPTLQLGDNMFSITLTQAGRMSRQYTIEVTRGSDVDYVKASNTGSDDNFGESVAIDGDTIVVGAAHEGSNATTINGAQDNDDALNAGAVYVFVRSGDTWVQQAYLKASNAEAYDYFGWSVAISGNTIAVGAPDESGASAANPNANGATSSGAVYIFTRTGTTWTQQAYVKAAQPGAYDYFGVALDLQGNRLVVGAVGEDSNATTVDGSQTNNSASGAGAAYVFERSGTTWTQSAYLKAFNTDSDDSFGQCVAVDGDTIVVGAPTEDSAATAVNGDHNNDSAGSAGAAYVFVRSGQSWTQQAYLKASNADVDDHFGRALDISGDTIAVGAYLEDGSDATPDELGADTGAVYVFDRSGTAWSQSAYVKPNITGDDDYFGASVALEGDVLVVAAVLEASAIGGLSSDPDNDDAYGAGAVYGFARTGNAWAQNAYVKATDPGITDQFGFSLATDNGVIVVGVLQEDSEATGINGDSGNDDAAESGAVYVYR